MEKLWGEVVRKLKYQSNYYRGRSGLREGGEDDVRAVFAERCERLQSPKTSSGGAGHKVFCRGKFGNITGNSGLREGGDGGRPEREERGAKRFNHT